MKKTIRNIYGKMYAHFSKYGKKNTFLRRLNKIVINKLRSDFVIIDGHKIFLDKKDCLRLSTRKNYEPFISQTCLKNINEGDTVIDLGANIGYYTLLFAKKVGKNGKVIAYEPHPDNFELLKKNVKVNEYNNVICEQKAVSNFNGQIKLFIDKDATTKHAIANSKYSSNDFVYVSSVKLDDHLSNIKIDFIKMDIEGAEFFALQGMENLLQKNKKIKLITEFTPYYFENLNINPSEVIDFFKKNEFNLYNINEEKETTDGFLLEEFSKCLKQRSKSAAGIYLLCKRKD